MHQYAYIGLALGQSEDYTALCVLEEQLLGDPGWLSPLALRPKKAEKLLAAQPFTATSQPDYPQLHVRHLQRFELGTKYTEIVEAVKWLLLSEQFRGRMHRVKLVIDKTGVGRPTMDVFTAAGVYPTGVTIHGGDRVTMEDVMNFRVPKRDLVASVQTKLQNGSLKVAKGLPEAPTLKQELQTFRLKIDPRTAHDTYSHWREGEHDDLVLAVALACWYRDYLVAWQYRDLAG